MKRFTFKKIIPAFTMVLVVVGGIFLYDSMSNESRLSEKDLRGIPEDSIAIIKDQFQLEDKHYMLLSEDQRIAFSLPESITEQDIGEKITTITTSVDADLIGSEVYEYLPAGGKAIVAVKKDSEYKLFKFFQFESYINNKDEDVITYLELFGINSAEDIKQVQFIGHSETAKIEGQLDIRSEITDIDQIRAFYQYYSVIKDSSEEYFEKLFNFQPSEPQNVVPDEPANLPGEPEKSVPMQEEPEKTIVEPVQPSDLPLENAPPAGNIKGAGRRFHWNCF